MTLSQSKMNTMHLGEGQPLPPPPPPPPPQQQQQIEQEHEEIFFC